MDANCGPAKRPTTVYIVAMVLGDTPVEFLCTDIIDDGQGFFGCGTCENLTKEMLEGWGVGDSINKIRRKTWINKRQVHSMEEVGEYNV